MYTQNREMQTDRHTKTNSERQTIFDFCVVYYRALTRPGRFDMVVSVPLPDVQGREDMFRYYLTKVRYDSCKFISPDVQSYLPFMICSVTTSPRSAMTAVSLSPLTYRVNSPL